jgi:RNA polymerase sigma-70 factor (ECF subfamily)
MRSDADLVRAVGQGDGIAFAELCTRWERPLYRFLHRCGSGDDADDLFQETWMRVVRSASRFDPERRFSTWLFQIALNLARDLGRRRARSDADAASEPIDDESPGRMERAIDARRLLDSLTEAQREVVVLRMFADLSEAECAEVLGCPRGTVKSRLHLAVKHLAERARGTGSSS